MLSVGANAPRDKQPHRGHARVKQQWCRSFAVRCTVSRTAIVKLLHRNSVEEKTIFPVRYPIKTEQQINFSIVSFHCRVYTVKCTSMSISIFTGCSVLKAENAIRPRCRSSSDCVL